MFPEVAEPEAVSEGHRRLVPEPLVLVLLCVDVADGYPEGAQRVGDDFSNLKKLSKTTLHCEQRFTKTLFDHNI